MLLNLLKWLRGYLLVSIKGYSPERFINLCSNRDIVLWNLKKSKDEYEFMISVPAFRRLKPIVKKTKTIPKIKKRYGLPFLLHRYRKRKTFFLGILLFFVILYTLSLFIWNIKIEGEYTHSKEQMLKYLKSINVECGELKKKMDCRKIEESIRGEYTDIGWVSCEIRGTRMIIKITETNMPHKAEKLTEPSHIVANKDGIIKHIITRKGTPKVTVDTVVKKGDILVSGIIELIDDSQTVFNREICAADADIVLKTFYEYNKEFSLSYIKKEYTNNEKKDFSLIMFGKKINLFKSRYNYDKYDIIEQENGIKFGEDFYLPITYRNTYYKEYKETKAIYTKNEAIALAEGKLDLYIQKLRDNGVIILENNVQIEVKNNKCISSGKLIVEESAFEYHPITDDEWRNQETDEHSGNNN